MIAAVDLTESASRAAGPSSWSPPMRPRPDHLRLVASREPEPDPTQDEDLTEIAAGVADFIMEKCGSAGRVATLDDVMTTCIFMFGHAKEKGAELQEVIRRCWAMVDQRQASARLVAAGRTARSQRAARSRCAVPARRDPDDQMLLPGLSGGML